MTRDSSPGIDLPWNIDRSIGEMSLEVYIGRIWGYSGEISTKWCRRHLNYLHVCTKLRPQKGETTATCDKV